MADSLAELVDAHVRGLGRTTAVVHGDERLTFEELAELTRRLASGLASLGIGRGDRVLLLLPNGPEFVQSFVAVASLGAGAVLVDPQSKEYELSFVFRDCGPKAVITNRQTAGRCRAVSDALGHEVKIVATGGSPSGALPLSSLLGRGSSGSPPTLSADDVVLYQYSSGSTGRPKRVGRTAAQCLAEASLLRETLELTPDDAILCAVPLFHAYGLGDCMLAALGSGTTLVIQPHPQPFAVNRQRTLDLLEEERVTVFPAVPFMIELLAAAPRDADLSSLRFCFSAGTALPDSAFSAFDERFGVPVRQLYGCTESPSISANLDPDPRPTSGSVGCPLQGVEVVIRQEDGAAQPPGAVGEISVRSPAAAIGYVNPELPEPATFRNGWIFPGDLGVMDDDGRLTIVGRTKTFIEVAGHKVDPLEVEDVLALHPAIAEAVVVGARREKPDDQVVKAAVVARAPCSERELIHFCKERLAAFKVPQVVEFRESIPRSSLGKVLRKELV